MRRTLVPTVGSTLVAFFAFAFLAAAAVAGPGDDAATQAHPLRVADASGLNGHPVSATVGDVALNGYVSKPEGAGPFPAVIMFHEWWGLNAHIKAQADTLAKEGFAVFAPDLYDGKVATDSKTAGQYMNELDQPKAKKTLKASYAWVRSQPFSHGKKVGSVGWCMGGGNSLQLALNEPTDAVVVYYGMVEKDPAVLKKLHGPLLGIFADRDGWITPALVKDFETALKATPVKHQIHHYDADHGFANPSNPNYKSDMATDAWNKTLAFLKANLK